MKHAPQILIAAWLVVQAQSVWSSPVYRPERWLALAAIAGEAAVLWWGGFWKL